MRSFWAFTLLMAVAVASAEESSQYRNAVGWEPGIAFRHYCSPKTWIGVNLNGSLRSSRDTSTTNSIEHYIPQDSVVLLTNPSWDSTTDYSISLKIELGRQFFRLKRFSVDGFIGVNYDYSYTTYNRGYSRITNPGALDYSYDYGSRSGPTHMVGATLGLEPKIWIGNRLSLGTQVGISSSYSAGKTKDYSTERSPNYTSTDIGEGTSTAWRVSTFGNISLNASLGAFFYF